MHRLSTDEQKNSYTPSGTSVIINWGNSRDNISGAPLVLNPVDRVRGAACKLHSFRSFEGGSTPESPISIPRFTIDRNIAAGWIDEGKVVVCRTVLRGHSGEGIVIATTIDELVDAPLYVEYVKKKKEFRVHVFKETIVDIQEKRRQRDHEGEPNFLVRNHHNGWVYCRDSIQEPTGLRGMAIKATSFLGLDFGAVDIIWNERQNQCYVLEVNTAPGLEGQTVDAYAQTFNTFLQENNHVHNTNTQFRFVSNRTTSRRTRQRHLVHASG